MSTNGLILATAEKHAWNFLKRISFNAVNCKEFKKKVIKSKTGQVFLVKIDHSREREISIRMP